MARLPYKDVGDVDPVSGWIIQRSPINLFRALANNPGALKQWFEFGEWIRWQSTLDPRLRELAILEVGVCAQSAYEFSHHVKIGRGFGVTDDDLAALAAFAAGERSEHFGAAELVVLSAARELTLQGRLSDALWGELVDRFDDAVALELVVVVGFYNMVVRVLDAVELDVEPEYAELVSLMPDRGVRSDV